MIYFLFYKPWWLKSSNRRSPNFFFITSCYDSYARDFDSQKFNVVPPISIKGEFVFRTFLSIQETRNQRNFKIERGRKKNTCCLGLGGESRVLSTHLLPILFNASQSFNQPLFTINYTLLEHADNQPTQFTYIYILTATFLYVEFILLLACT